ncbi:helix-turn-helix domain-containing protein [Bacillus sp. CH30_1T]|nr:helix-turn-helix domain-containing protein [Bacillus sp. CH30_1T]
MIMKPLLREYRFKRNVDQKQVAEVIGVSQQIYSLFERGKQLPRIDIAFKIANYYGCKVDDLYEYEVIKDD